jgi:hypothetical protein
LVLHILQHRDRYFEGKGHVELAADEGQHRCRAVRDDRVFDAVEIRPARLPVIGVLRDLDRLVRFELDKFERPCADGALPHLRRRNMTGVHRRVSRGDQCQQGRLRPLQYEGRFEIAVYLDVSDIVPPGFARVGAEAFLAAPRQEVPGAFDVGRGEGLAVMPFDAGMQFEGQRLPILAP